MAFSSFRPPFCLNLEQFRTKFVPTRDQGVSQLEWFIACVSTLRRRFALHRTVHVGFVVDKVAMRQCLSTSASVFYNQKTFTNTSYLLKSKCYRPREYAYWADREINYKSKIGTQFRLYWQNLYGNHEYN